MAFRQIQWKVQSTFNVCLNISHLSLSLMCIVQSSLHPELPRPFPLWLLVQMLGHCFILLLLFWLFARHLRAWKYYFFLWLQAGRKRREKSACCWDLLTRNRSGITSLCENGWRGQVYSWSTMAAESSTWAVFSSLLRKYCAIYGAAKSYKMWRDLFS